jgi:adenylate cyclase
MLLLERIPKGETSPLYAHITLAQAHIGIDRKEETQTHAAEVLKINPNFSLERRQKRQPFKDPAHWELLSEALRKAGVPE